MTDANGTATDTSSCGGPRRDRSRLPTIPNLMKVARWTRCFSRSEIPCLPDLNKKNGLGVRDSAHVRHEPKGRKRDQTGRENHREERSESTHDRERGRMRGRHDPGMTPSLPPSTLRARICAQSGFSEACTLSSSTLGSLCRQKARLLSSADPPPSPATT